MATFDCYEIRATLRDGPYAAVYRAWDRERGREVVLKLPAAALLADPDIRDRFLTTMRAYAAVRHPHLATVFEVGELAGRPYLAMESIRGRPLHDVIGGGLPLVRATIILMAVGGAVERLHAAGTVHGGITSGNVMVEDEGGRAVLLDPGVTRLVRASRRLSTIGVVPGMPEYIPPDAEPHGPRADIYALGVLAFHLLTGRPPYTGSWGEVALAHARAPVPPLWELRPDLPGPIIAAVLEALAKDPAHRPPGAAALVAPFAARLTPAAPETDIDRAHPLGIATMEEDGTVVLELHPLGPHGMPETTVFRFPPSHRSYREVVEHVGGLRPGERKPVPRWRGERR
jgi:serine/threonine protein kinase